MSTHEDFKAKQDVKQGSDQSFGLVFSGFFAIIGLWPLIHAEMPRLWALVLAALFLAVSFIRPELLKPLNRVWFLFGLLLHKIVSPLIMGLLFFLTVTPTALIMRARGKDLLRLKRDPKAASYWILRDPPGPDAGGMTRQF
ncbi:MAG: SxtJ family membrane protein [Rhodospirillales bacterium]|nr:SxtJ family membrane protein [Rhodospirillales bacterium]